MEIRAVMDGRSVQIEPDARGALLLSDPDGLMRLRDGARVRAQAALALGAVFAAIALYYTNAWFLVAMGLMLSIAWLSIKRSRELLALSDIGPGVYERGVQLASETFIPFHQVSRVSRTGPSRAGSGPGIVLTSAVRGIEWEVPASVVGLEGLALIEEMAGGGPATGEAPWPAAPPLGVVTEARLGSESS